MPDRQFDNHGGFDDVGLRSQHCHRAVRTGRWAAPDAVAVDEGLRAYMLRIYNYMVLGLAITGFAALGIYMLSVTGSLDQAAYVLRGSDVLPRRRMALRTATSCSPRSARRCSSAR